MTKSWNKNTQCTRTKEGLIAHHKYENYAIILSKKEIAMSNPFEWQLAEKYGKFKGGKYCGTEYVRKCYGFFK